MTQNKVQDPNSLPWNPDNTSFPLRKDVPKVAGALEESAWVWGENDSCGRLNLLTPARVKAASAEIKTGETVPLDLPTNVPAQPAFGRQVFKQEIKALRPGKAYDDIYFMNTQSGTQWDGLRHVAHQATGTFYNNTNAADIEGPKANLKNSIHHLREHGFTGRAVFLDYRSWATLQGRKYDAAESHEISYDDLEAVGKHQGFDIRPASQGGDVQIGDILFIRSGWKEDYDRRTAEQNAALGFREGLDNRWVGVKRETKMLDWLHDCYFSAVGGDTPAIEVFPMDPESWSFHEYLLAMWGVPIGEMVDLEKVSELAKKHKRSTFFFTSAPFRTHGGIASYLNATAIF